MTTRRQALCLLAASGLGTTGLAAAQQAPAGYPNRPIRFIVPFPPGGSLDPIARLVGQKLGESLGQPVVVDNRPGANTIIGTDAVAKAPADGYTLLYTASTHVINALVVSSLPYDTWKDFEPVTSTVRSDLLLVVHPSVPVKNLQEFITWTRSRPDGANYAISGTANPNHLAGELFSQVTGVKMNAIPYKGGGPAINDLLAGQVHAMFVVPTSVAGHVKTGRLRALAYTGPKPVPGLDVPTFAQAGLGNFDINSWNAFFVRSGTPRPIIERLAAEIDRILKLPDVVEKLAAQGQDPWVLRTEQFAARLQADRQKYGAIIKAANIKLD